MKVVDEKFRIKTGQFASTQADGNNGIFSIPHYKINEYVFLCVVSDGNGWDHVSVSLLKNKGRNSVDRTCTWQEMCFIKEQFFNDDEAVMQLHPAAKDHVSMHPYCLHLWRPQAEKIPIPNPLMVGIPGMNVQSF